MVTGESMPVTKTVAAHVVAGTMNQTGSLIVRADKVGRDTMLARIVQMVADAQRSRAPIQRMADKVAGWFVPAVLGVALLSFARSEEHKSEIQSLMRISYVIFCSIIITQFHVHHSL